RSVNYNIETVDKVVHVTGLARSGAELSRVLDRASRIPGVVKVVSHVLTIDDPRRQATSSAARTTG
ncbi:MAG: phospholipid-binding domain-containing protein, partial [Pseudomonadota bacterium]